MCRVVLVEDSNILRQGMIRTFDWKAASCRVVGDADNGQDGLALIRQVQPDIVITDIRMPVIDGLEMIRRLREEGSKAVFILISAYDEFSFAQQAIRYGVTEFLVKPFANAEFVRALGRAVAQARNLRQLESLHGRVERMEQERLYGPYVPEEGGLKGKYVQMAVDFIKARYASGISVGQIAEHLSMSEGHLSKVFKEIQGCTVGEYMTEYRISEACKLLAQAGMRVNEAAEAVGYSDQRYFSVVFRRVMGMTPNEFRNRFRA